MWHIANEIIWTDDDSYVNKGGSDYYIHLDKETNRIQLIEYDGNSTFNTRNVNWNPFLKEKDKKYPIINKLFASNELKQRYIAHIRTIINDVMNSTNTNSIIDEYKALIQEEVYNDPKKIYSSSQFNSSINEIKAFINNRKNNLLNNAFIKAIPPEIVSVNNYCHNNEHKSPQSDDTIIINAKVESTSGINKVMLYFATGLMGPFERIQMFDDGNHNDGELADGLYGAQINPYPSGTYVRYYIEAISNNQYNTSSYSPEGAEHNVYIYQVKQELEDGFPVMINEVMASNTKTIADPQGEFDDWIELFNKGDKTVNLTNLYLSDKPDNLKKWKFPDNTLINPGEYLLIWCDENSKANPGIHTNFKLSADGEVVFLVNNDENKNSIIDSISFGKQESDISFGSYPNGSGQNYFMNPTPMKYNDNILSSIRDNEFSKPLSIEVFPNPFSELLNINIESSNYSNYRIEIYDVMGNIIYTINPDNLYEGNKLFIWNSTDKKGIKVSQGVYFIKAINDSNNYLIKPVVKF